MATHEASRPEPTPFQKFEALTRRILTTPKSELMKDGPKKSAKLMKKRK